MDTKADKKASLSEGQSGEILAILASIKSLLMLAEYQQNTPETNNFLYLATICITNLQNQLKR